MSWLKEIGELPVAAAVDSMGSVRANQSRGDMSCNITGRGVNVLNEDASIFE